VCVILLRWTNVLERVVKLELPQEDDIAFESTSSATSSRSLEPRPTDVEMPGSPGTADDSADSENIYETLS